jgi:adenosine kinase
VRIAVTGSIATDHLMTFPGRFADQLVAERLEKVSLSFLVDDLAVHRGGVAGNISFGLAQLGLRPVLVAAVGEDFADYRAALDARGVDTSAVAVSQSRHTARFTSTSDRDGGQLASFYPGAMSEARDIALAPIAERLGGLDLVIVGANDPEAMLRHTRDAHDLGIPVAADPSQQLSSLEGPQIEALVDGAAYLFCNHYEAALIERKTGWSPDDVDKRVGTRVRTLGADGVLARCGGEEVAAPGVPVRKVVEPTGAGDALRAGFLAARSWGLALERCAQLGNVLAALRLEAAGPQEYAVHADDVSARLATAYGDAAAAEIAAHLPA